MTISGRATSGCPTSSPKPASTKPQLETATVQFSVSRRTIMAARPAVASAATSEIRRGSQSWAVKS